MTIETGFIAYVTLLGRRAVRLGDTGDLLADSALLHEPREAVEKLIAAWS